MIRIREMDLLQLKVSFPSVKLTSRRKVDCLIKQHCVIGANADKSS